MTTVLVSGATGYAGRFIAEGFLAAGADVIVMGRTWPPPGFFSEPVEWVAGDLDPDHDFRPAFDGVDMFVHCAFQHVPGKYRGGEGDDPGGFRRANVDGTLALMAAAKRAGVSRALFLSSRAVYGPHPPGMVLTEDMPCVPDTLYGETKRAVETALTAMASDRFLPVIARATGIYGPAGPGRAHKWADLFSDFVAGRTIALRVGTEVHGDDFAAAVRLLATRPAADLMRFGAAPVFNVSDILLDRHDLLTAYADRAGIAHAPPPRAAGAAFNAMDTARLRALGWRPRGTLDLTGLV
ncbi:MAG: NAD(P)-dependent oxidoreductase [Roseitalea sp.]|jgi:nucleoside-diphosphate-sugar epimerase|nr:NAD(P)-dependent oxidoreductase [Roseitalea sp.]MBO6721576.1 NAD(P)-dependent oxidoreductase [Roseitalea sp.]MBO6743332.1 NAD(P)-dependent oxidoreductase [Roseitalea sp.]